MKARDQRNEGKSTCRFQGHANPRRIATAMTKQESPGLSEAVPYADITVLIHGPILRESTPGSPRGMTHEVVQSVRHVLPGAKIVISTWDGSGAEDFGAEMVVYSSDPGGSPYAPGARLNNVNRQIVAMRAGLERIDTRWALKLRSDTKLVSAGMATLWPRYQARNPGYGVFERRIVTSAILTYNARLCIGSRLFTPFLFHVNDMIQFGLTSDLRRLWYIPTMPLSDFEFFSKEELEGQVDKISNRRVPEDYIWTCALKAAGFTTNDSWMDISPGLLAVSELSIVNNFQLLDHAEMGFHCLKYPNFDQDFPIDMPFFTHRGWLSCYQLYCDPLVVVPVREPITLRSLRRRLQKGLNPARVIQYLKRRTRPFRFRIKEMARRIILWK